MNIISTIKARLRPLTRKEIIMVSVGVAGVGFFLMGLATVNTPELLIGTFLMAASFIVTAYYWVHRHDEDEADVD